MQRGNLFLSHGSWYVRFYEDGKRVTKLMGRLEDYPTKRLIEPLVQDLMRKVNASSDPSVLLDDFIRDSYLPHVERELRPSVYRGYKNLYGAYVVGRPECQLRVREYTTAKCQAMLNSISDERELAKSTLAHIKFFFSGVFVWAAQCGIREGNPMRETRVTRTAKASATTYAYSLAEIQKMLMLLDHGRGGDHGALRAAVAVAAFAGLRLSELHGLEWSDYDGKDLMIRRSVWRGHESEPKTSKSRDYVPVIPSLKLILDGYKATVALGATRMFSELDSWESRLAVKSALAGTGLVWRGWHAFRRGIASNLFELGVDDLTVQRVLRHAKVTVTRESYIKMRSITLDAAMAKLEGALGVGGNA